jgi:predicted transcriptional regulator YdeE
MENYHLSNDVEIMCLPVPTFPNGIPDAFDKLSKMFPTLNDRVFYGISYNTKEGEMIYKAAVSSNAADEAGKLNLEPFTISKGEYLTETIVDWRNKISNIGKTFQALVANETIIDKYAVCIEWYKTDDELMCMVKTK